MYDFIQLLNDYSIPFVTSVNDGWVNIQCPLCGDSSLHGGLNLSNDYYHCFRCGGHTVEWVVSHLLGISKRQTEELLRDYSGRLSIPDKLNKKSPHAKRVELPGGELEPMHRKYLKCRGFDPQQLSIKYGVCGVGIVGEWCFRIIIPIFYSGVIVSFQGRDITGKAKLRYKTLEIEKSVMDPKSVLYNIDNATGESVVVVEGAFDSWRIGDGCVATLGTSMTPAQVNLLAQRYNRVVFLFDPEEEAQDRAEVKAKQLSCIVEEVYVFELDGDSDPATLSDKEVKRVRQEAGI